MLIHLQKLAHLAVYTESGENLGKVYDLAVDVEGHCIKYYLVKAGLLSQKHYLIKINQIKAVKEDRLIVEDAVLKQEHGEEEKGSSPIENFAGAMRTEEG